MKLVTAYLISILLQQCIQVPDIGQLSLLSRQLQLLQPVDFNVSLLSNQHLKGYLILSPREDKPVPICKMLERTL